MSPAGSEQPDTIFATPFRPRPDDLRTYSHKRGSNTHARSLPRLKPQTPPRRARPRLSQTNASLFSSPGGTFVSDDHDSNPHDLNPPHALDENTAEPEQEIGEQDVPTQAVVSYEDVYDPAESDIESQHDSHDAPSAAEPSDTDTDSESDSSDDSVKHISRDTRKKDAPNKPTGSTSVPIPSQVKSTRRRPFLIFDKTPKKPTSFKKLNQKRDVTKSSYIPGDGFSDSEARPNGVFQLTKKRKLHFSVPAVGILDLTQAPPPPTKPSTAKQPKEPRIIFKRKKRVFDNSFLPPTPKKVRRERRDEQEKDMRKKPDTQATVIEGLSAPYGRVLSSVILGASPNDGPVVSLLPDEAKTTATEDTNDTKNDAVEPALPPPVTVGANGQVAEADPVALPLPPPVNVSIDAQVIKKDIICVAFSDLPFDLKKESNSSQDSVYVPETSQPRSMSLQPNPPTVEDQAEGAEQSSRRVFQRNHTG